MTYRLVIIFVASESQSTLKSLHSETRSLLLCHLQLASEDQLLLLCVSKAQAHFCFDLLFASNLQFWSIISHMGHMVETYSWVMHESTSFGVRW